MKDHITYRGWAGSVEFSEEDGVLHGKLLGTDDLISYEGETVADLVRDFHESVDEYIDFCLENSKPSQPQEVGPEFRFKPEVYLRLVEASRNAGLPFQTFVEETLLWGINQRKAS